MSDQITNEKNHMVIFMPSGRRGVVPAGTTVLEAARELGVAIASICGGNMTCNKCLVRLESGDFAKHGIRSAAAHLSPAGADENKLLTELESLECRLSCQAEIQGDALLFVPEESRARQQIIRKSATERAIQLNPAIRKLYVRVESAQLGDYRSDWERLKDALREQYGVEAAKIDFPVLRTIQPALRKEGWNVTVTLWQEHEVIDVQPGLVEGVYGLAVDIGSTTIAGFLCDLLTGDILAHESIMNPQVTYGEDLMSRVSYAMTNRDGLKKMHEAIIAGLNRLGAQVARSAGIRPRQIHEAVFVGNTTMIHILLGIDPLELGGAPFALATRESVDVKARDLGLRFHNGANIHVLPSEAGHVGADNVGVLVAELPHQFSETVLVVDVGTNAEIVLGHNKQLYSASSPTGPAFEGAQIAHGMRAAAGAIERVRIDPITKQGNFRVIGEERWSNDWNLDADAPLAEQPAHLASGICGSGIIEVIAEMFLAGILMPDGRFDPTCVHDRVQFADRKGSYTLATADQTTTGKPIVVTQDDVRNIQLAKAALYAGAKLLMGHAGVAKVDRIIMAGAFGSYIDPKYAMILGLIPDCNLEMVNAVGNAAGDGARIALLNRERRAEAERLAHWVNYVETAVHPDFQDEFVGAIHLPHATDNFEHLNDILPKAKPPTAAAGGRGNRRRRRALG